jgi:AbrB family looped-hinge helix DNA binding protein
MSYHAKVSRGGIITIPAELRRQMGVSQGGIIIFEKDGDGGAVFQVEKQLIRGAGEAGLRRRQ